MNSDPRHCVVVFELAVGNNDTRKVAVAGLAESEQLLREAWAQVAQEHSASPADVLRIYSEWEPAKSDKDFAKRTFPYCQRTWSFPRPQPGGWEEAYRSAIAEIERVAASKAGEERR